MDQISEICEYIYCNIVRWNIVYLILSHPPEKLCCSSCLSNWTLELYCVEQWICLTWQTVFKFLTKKCQIKIYSNLKTQGTTSMICDITKRLDTNLAPIFSVHSVLWKPRSPSKHKLRIRFTVTYLENNDKKIVFTVITSWTWWMHTHSFWQIANDLFISASWCAYHTLYRKTAGCKSLDKASCLSVHRVAEKNSFEFKTNFIIVTISAQTLWITHKAIKHASQAIV